MELKYLYTVKKIIETGSYQKAARALNYAQSTITFQIKQLESELSVKIFEKSGSRMELTQAGAELLPLIDNVVTATEELLCFKNSENEIRGTLKVALPETLVTYQMQPILKEFKEKAPKLMKTSNIPFLESNDIGTKVYVAVDNQFAGCIVISDEIKEDSRDAIAGLKARGIRKTVMLTGDNAIIGEAIAKELALDEVYAGLLPDQKVEKLEMLDGQKRYKGKLAFVGDGINDAPVLARADVGIAMGGLGSDAAIEAADIVLMTDEPSKLLDAIDIAKFTKRIVWQNIFFALGIKGIFLLLGAFGIATMWEAVFADVGVSVIAILNAMRVMRMK